MLNFVRGEKKGSAGGGERVNSRPRLVQNIGTLRVEQEAKKIQKMNTYRNTEVITIAI